MGITPAKAGPFTACDQVWQTDISYVRIRAGWLYLAVVIDARGKRVLGRTSPPRWKPGLSFWRF